MTETSIYLHIPFCAHRCAYCDFNTYAGQESLIPAYIDALIREIETVSALQAHPAPVHTLFFGGGTPSLLPTPHLSAVMDALRRAFALTANLEATLEANPGTVTAQSLKELHAAGLNRLSFGVQSANPNELRLLERAHGFFDVIQSVKWARQAGFKRLNLDLIYGLPEQTLADWQNSVKRIADLGPEHISMYGLTIEHGTPFGRWAARGLLPLPNPDLAADMYEWAAEYLGKQTGYAQYEISNWATPGEESRHNLQYWRNLPYYGFGAGAHGYIDGTRSANVSRIKTYISRLKTSDSPSVAKFSNRPSPRQAMQETLMLGLRLTQEGVSNTAFHNRFGMGILEAFPREISELTELGLLEWHEQDTLRLTPRARLIGNQVFMRFV